MPRRDRKATKETKVERATRRIGAAKSALERTILEPLLEHVTVELCSDLPDDPLLACVSPADAAVFVNPHRRPDLSEDDWAFVLAHEILHLGLGHHRRRMERDPFVWCCACDLVVDNLVASLRLGKAPTDLALDPVFSGAREEEAYDAIVAEKGLLGEWVSPAGKGRADIVSRTPRREWYRSWGVQRRWDHEELLAEGIRSAVDDAVRQASEALSGSGSGREAWAPGARAKEWVIFNCPLFGALASALTVYADSGMTDRMGIAIAAVNPYLGEIYLNPNRPLSTAEWRFVYMHELLHVALMHQGRLTGRDPYVWNCACDFVINAWLIEMGVGTVPSVGCLYDPRLYGMSAEEVYDLLVQSPARCKRLRGFRGGPGDILWDAHGRTVRRDDGTTLDDMVRRCLAAGLALTGRGHVPAGLLEEVRSLFTPPVPWDVELARWMEAHVPYVREACTFGVVMDTSGSMDRELLGRALGAIASFAEARDVPAVRLVMCDAQPYDRGFVCPADVRGVFPVIGRGGTVLQPAVNHLLSRADLPDKAPIMIITDGWCEEEIVCPRDHCFVLPRKSFREGALPLRTSAPIFRVLRDDQT